MQALLIAAATGAPPASLRSAALLPSHERTRPSNATVLIDSSSGTCKAHCMQSDLPWCRKCNWDNCSGCTECPAAPCPACKDWCATKDDKPWCEKCNFANCTECGECLPEPPSCPLFDFERNLPPAGKGSSPKSFTTTGDSSCDKALLPYRAARCWCYHSDTWHRWVDNKPTGSTPPKPEHYSCFMEDSDMETFELCLPLICAVNELCDALDPTRLPVNATRDACGRIHAATMTAPTECSALGIYGNHYANVSCDGERLSLSSASTADAAACNDACVQEQAVAWTWHTASHECWCKEPPTSPTISSAGVVSGLACF